MAKQQNPIIPEPKGVPCWDPRNPNPNLGTEPIRVRKSTIGSEFSGSAAFPPFSLCRLFDHKHYDIISWRTR